MGEYDLGILGGGPGGYAAAVRAAQLGARVALAEKGDLGGTCLNRGCIPAKALLEEARRRREAGPPVTEEILERLRQRSDAVVVGLRTGVTRLLEKFRVAIFREEGRLEEGGIRLASGAILACPKVILATGSTVVRPALFGSGYWTSDEVLARLERPARLLIVGGGVIGCEMADLFATLGTAVTLVEMEPRLLPVMDEELAREMERSCKKKKIAVRCGVRIESVASGPEGFRAVLADGEALAADRLLVAVGRRPVTDPETWGKLGIAFDGPRVKVDAHLLTTRPGVYAIGDVASAWQLAHVAYRQGEIAAAHALGKTAAMEYRAVPSVVYTSPSAVSVGLTETDARGQGEEVTVGRCPFRAIGRAHTLGEISGWVKLVARRSDQVLLGAQLFGPQAEELLPALSLAILQRLPVAALEEVLYAHPTLSEAIGEAASALLGRPLHA